MSASDLDVLEDAQGVGNEDRGRVVRADQVVADRLLVDVHLPDVEPRLVLVGKPRLVQADHPFVLLARAEYEDRAGARLRDRDLVAGQDWDAAPGRRPG